MCTEVKLTNDKSRRERRKEVRLAKNKKKFDSWVQHHQSKISSSDLKSESAKKLLKNNGTSDCTQMVEKTKTEGRGFVTNGANEQPHNLRKSGIRKELKRKKDSSTTPKSNFFKLLEMEMKGRVVSEEEDLRLERRLAKKLKVKNGKLRAANDDLDMLLEGIPSFHYYNTGGIGKVFTSAQDDAISWKSKMDNSINEDLDDDISSDEESDSLASSEEHEDVLGKNSNKRRKTKFEEHLGTENNGDKDDEGFNMLLDGVPSVLDTLEDKRKQNHAEYEKRSLDNSISYDNIDTSTLAQQEKKVQTISSNVEASGPSQKYVAPHLRSHYGHESLEHAQVRKRVRGLLNRLSETNVESITGEISALFHSVGRSVGSQIISEEVVASCSGGPRGNEQYAAVFAAFVAGMACLVGIDFGAKLLAALQNVMRKSI